MSETRLRMASNKWAIIKDFRINLQSREKYCVRNGPFDIQGGGGWYFLKKNSFFLSTEAKKIKCLQPS